MSYEPEQASVVQNVETPGKEPSSRADKISYTQWAVGPNETYYATSETIGNIPPGVYSIQANDGRIFWQKMRVETDKLLELDDSPTRRVLAGIRKFWEMRETYENYEISYRRGVLLSGPPGSGKTASISILTKELVDSGGIVVYVGHPAIAAIGLQHLRTVEPHRPLICVFEDIDEMLENNGEHWILSILDGENKINNCVNLATTNYPDQLAARIVNRPSRFDEHIRIGMPNDKARRQFLEFISRKAGVDSATLDQWVRDTKELGIAHLKELFIAVHCLENPYEEVIDRLKKMASKPPAAEKEFGSQSPKGFNGGFFG